MQLAERHIIKYTEARFDELDNLAFQSKNLYNAANYIIRQNFLYGWGYLTYNQMASLMKSHPAYQALPAKVSRGLYKTKDGLLINADVNGSYNIMRKAFPLCVEQWDRELRTWAEAG